MAFFDDFAKAGKDYPSISVTLGIIHAAFVSAAPEGGCEMSLR